MDIDRDFFESMTSAVHIIPYLGTASELSCL